MNCNRIELNLHKNSLKNKVGINYILSKYLIMYKGMYDSMWDMTKLTGELVGSC